jgi:DNA topoisomerase VI subunit B
MSAVRRLERVAFTTSRLSEFVGTKELTAQTGQNPYAWPLLILKELADNALDACEEAGVAPVIEVDVDTDRGLIIVADNGPGIPADMIERMLDYTTRTSSREAYISPTRGAQGNALKTIVAMGFALDGKHGLTVIEAQGQRHSIAFEMDAVRREPKITHEIGASFVQNGTRVTVHWPNSASSILCRAKSRFVQIAADLIWLNPHLSLSCVWDGELCVKGSAMDPGWGEGKWRPSDPTSPHWYNTDTFSRYIAAHVARDQDNGASRTVREFIGELRGLSRTATQKRVLDAVGAARASLSAFFAEGKNEKGVARLLAACRTYSKPVKPEGLGFIGEDNLRARLLHVGAIEGSIKYKRQAVLDSDGMPWAIEAAFGLQADDARRRLLIAGINCSPAIGDPFASLGPNGDSLSSILAEQWADADEPIVFVLHATTPRPPFVDRGKSAVRLESVADEIEGCILSVTKAWATQRAHEFRNQNAILHRKERLASTRQQSMSIKDAAELAMEEAYLKASGGGQYPVKARQLMYAARPAILAMTQEPFTDAYFTQTVLVDYLNSHLEQAQRWDVVWDARGTFREPHTGRTVPIGTLEVRDYLGRQPERSALWSNAPIRFERGGYPTVGPEARYNTVLFVEKEGFDPLLRAAKLRRPLRYSGDVDQGNERHSRSAAA